MDLVPGPVEEAGVDEHDPVFHRVDTSGEVGAGTAFLIHHADLDGVTRQAQQVFGRIEQVVGEGAFLRSVHLGFDDVDAAATAVGKAALPDQADCADCTGQHGIHDPFRDLAAISQQDRRVGHQVADITHEQQTASGQDQVAPVAVRVERAGQRLTALLKAFRQITPDHSEPVGIGQKLVFGIDCRDRIFEVADCGQRGFENHVGDPQRISAANRMLQIDHNFNVQAIVLEQKPSRSAGHQVSAVFTDQRSLPARHRTFQKRARRLNHRRSAHRVIAAGLGRGRIERVGAVIGIIEAAPAGVGGVEQEPGIEHRHHQLRPGHRCDLGIDVLRADLEWRGFGNQIADFAQEGLIFGLIDRFACARRMPRVDLCLQVVPLGEQRAVDRHVPRQKRRKASPERCDILALRGQHFVFDKSSQRRIHLKP